MERVLWPDQIGMLSEVRMRAAGEVTSYTYDANHEVTSVTDPELHTRLITPEVDGATPSARTENNFEGQQTVTTYFQDHNVKDITEPGHIVTSFTYDTKGRVSTVHPAAFAVDKVIHYDYDDSTVYTKRITATYPDNSTEISKRPVSDPLPEKPEAV